MISSKQGIRLEQQEHAMTLTRVQLLLTLYALPTLIAALICHCNRGLGHQSRFPNRYTARLYSSVGDGSEQVNRGYISQSLESRSLTCLDLSYVLTSLKSFTSTKYASDLLSRVIELRDSSDSLLRTRDHVEATLRYNRVSELSSQLGYIPLRSGATTYLLHVVRLIEFNLSPGPSRSDLAGFSIDLECIHDLFLFLQQNIDKGSMSKQLFDDLAERLVLSADLVETFKDSFEASTSLTASGSAPSSSHSLPLDGNEGLEDMVLSSAKYPVLKNLRARAATLKSSIVQTLNALLQSPEMKEKIADQLVP